MTGESLYELHRRELNHQGITTKGAFQEAKPPRHWFELDERTRQAWEGTARQVNEAHRRSLQAVSAAHWRDPNVHGTPRITDGMLRSEPKAAFPFPG